MSEYMFGTTKSKITKREGTRRDRIARKHGGAFVGPITLPGNAVTGWFAVPNRGEPFNKRAEQAILKECGL